MEAHYWELIQQNAAHIKIINGELSLIVERLARLETQMQIMIALLIGLAGKAAWEVFSHFKNNRK